MIGFHDTTSPDTTYLNEILTKAVLQWMIAKVEEDGTDNRIAAQIVDQFPTYSNRLVGEQIEKSFDNGGERETSFFL